MRKKRSASRRIIRWLFFGFVALLGFIAVFLARPAYYLARAAITDKDEREAVPAGSIEDASRLDRTAVKEVWPVPADKAEAEVQLAALLKRAKQERVPVSIGGARHSMGGHSIAPDGIVIDMRPFNAMKLDEAGNILTVQSGAIWADIIMYLDQHQRSVAIMQSNSSFTVGGSISVNCHGWQYDRPPIASSVESFRLMLADGSIVNCSRTENTELFSLVLGGYGLFGIILDVQLKVVPNTRLIREQHTLPIDSAFSAFEQTMEDWPDAAMVYGRLNVAENRFLRDITMIALHPEASEPPALVSRQAPGLRRTIFRASAQSDYGKEMRWRAETQLLPRFSKSVYSRNELLNEGVEVYEDRSADTTNILHEYFIPREKVSQFLDELRRIVPAHDGNLVNVTVRSVNADPDVFLRYADRSLFAFVMLFSQRRDAAGESEMESMTREMIDAAIACKGRYYLPYRLHATQEQFEKAYPRAKEFFERKRRYDPDELFKNRFYLKYGAAQAPSPAR